MASLHWTKLNPTVKIQDTRKKFFNKFLYKADVYLPAGELIRNTKFTDMKFLLEQRASWHGRNINYGGSWFGSGPVHGLSKSIENAQLSQLEYWRDCLKLPGYQFRVEEPLISIYSNNEQALYKLVANQPGSNMLHRLFKPISTTATEALDRGEIILKKSTEYNYRIYLKEGKISADVAEALYQLLTNQGDDVKMTKSCSANLISRRYWFTSTYFYTKSLDVLTMINLISPDVVSGFFKVVYMPE